MSATIPPSEWIKVDPNPTFWEPEGTSFLLLETGDFLLLQTSGKIILEGE
jgi:hypothetical protein